MPSERVLTHDLHRKLGELLDELRSDELHDGRLGTRVLALLLSGQRAVAHHQVRPKPHLEPRDFSAPPRVFQHRAPIDGLAGSDVLQLVQHVSRRPDQREQRPLMAEQRLGHRPAVVEAANDVLFGNLHVVEKRVAEGRGVTERQHGLDLDARCLEIDQQERDPFLLLLGRGVGPHEAEGPVGVLRPGSPSLLAVEDEVVARVLGAHPQRREVTSRVRFGVALTPELLAGEDLRKEAFFLSVRPKLHDQRTDHREAKHRYPQGTDHLQLFVEDETLGRVPTRTTELLRPVGRDPSFVVKDLMPSNGLFEVVPSRALRGDTQILRHRLSHPSANFLTKCLFFLGEGEIHAGVHDTMGAKDQPVRT